MTAATFRRSIYTRLVLRQYSRCSKRNSLQAYDNISRLQLARVAEKHAFSVRRYFLALPTKYKMSPITTTTPITPNQTPVLNMSAIAWQLLKVAAKTISRSDANLIFMLNCFKWIVSVPLC